MLVCNKPAISTISWANGIKRPILETASSLYGAKWEPSSIPPAVSENGEGGSVGDAELAVNMVQVNLHGPLGQP
jgi:hypothetical protein